MVLFPGRLIGVLVQVAGRWLGKAGPVRQISGTVIG